MAMFAQGCGGRAQTVIATLCRVRHSLKIGNFEDAITVATVLFSSFISLSPVVAQGHLAGVLWSSWWERDFQSSVDGEG